MCMYLSIYIYIYIYILRHVLFNLGSATNQEGKLFQICLTPLKN